MAADVAKETIKDARLAIVYQYVMKGWPHKVQSTSGSIEAILSA